MKHRLRLGRIWAKCRNGAMRWSCRRVAYTLLAVYFLVTCYTGFILFRKRFLHGYERERVLQKIRSLTVSANEDDWNPWGEEFENEGRRGLVRHPPPPIQWGEGERPLGLRSPLVSPDNSSEEVVVEVWGKAAVGLYLWEHILNSGLQSKLGGVWSYGETKVNNIRFKFRTGPGVVPGKVPRHVENLLLVVNGREPGKVDFARMWLNFLPTLPYLRNAAVLMLGNERCDNAWLMPYLHTRGGLLKAAFLVYDSPDIDNQVLFQWPLGVATYRDFPKVDSPRLPLDIARKYTFSFLGTVYRNSSREKLMSVLHNTSNQQPSFVKTRSEWLPKETDSSLHEYLQALRNSDLTLHPVGINSECYRLYEAMAYGSIPVVEDVMTPGRCGPSPSLPSAPAPPLRLLKEFHAPVLWIQDWSELPGILAAEAKMSHKDKVARRQKLVQWYENFKSIMKDRLVRVLEERFFNIKR